MFSQYERHGVDRSIRPGSIVVDVGANVGLFSLRCAEEGARVVALEPSPDAYLCLEENVKRLRRDQH